MARQCSPITLSGTLDQITFYHHPDDGPLAKVKSDIDRKKVLTDERFARTLRNAREFQRAIKGGKQLRSVLFLPTLKSIPDSKLSSRMNKVLREVVLSDKGNLWGDRLLHLGDPGLLKGFNFNRKMELGHCFRVNYAVNIDRVAGSVRIDVPEFSPLADIGLIEGARYFKIVSVVAVMDFEHEKEHRYLYSSPVYKIGEGLVESFSIEHSLLDNVQVGRHIFLTLGIVFYGKKEDVPKESMSKRKRRMLRDGQGEQGCAAFTGAMEVLEAWKVG